MNQNQTESKPESAEQPSGKGLSVQRLVRPRRETTKWSRLARLLDEILTQADYNAIHQGFVRGKTRELDAALSRIIYAATEAKKLLRPNA